MIDLVETPRKKRGQGGVDEGAFVEDRQAFPDIRVTNDMLPLDAALFYAQRGLFVIMLKAWGKAPHPYVAKGWTSKSTLDPNVIKEWWGLYPDANVGVSASQEYVILDLDVKDVDANGLKAFAGTHEHLLGPSQLTPSGGVHRIFRRPNDERADRNLSPRKGGFDFMQDRRRQIVVAPSVIAVPGEENKQYRWTQGGQPAPMPKAAIDKMYELAGRHVQRENDPSNSPEVPTLGKVIKHDFKIETGDRSHGAFALSRDLFTHHGDASDGDILATVWEVPAFSGAAIDRRHDHSSAMEWLWRYCVWPAEKSRFTPGEWDGYDPRTLMNRRQAPWEVAATDTTILSSADFAKGLSKPTYIVRRLSLQKGQLVTLTAHPGHFKTGVMMEVTYRMALGREIDNIEVKPRKVLFFAGENNEDNRLRFVHTCLDDDVDTEDVGIDWVDRAFQMTEENAKQMVAEAEGRGEYDLIVIDTMAAYFLGDDENSNTEMHAYMQVLRSMTKMKGSPCVVVLSHPAKSSSPEDLKPRGGYAVFGTIDGNLTLHMERGIAKLHHSAKWRGASFKPLYWQPKLLRHQSVTDSDGIEMPSVRAEIVPEIIAREIEKRDHMKALLYLRNNPKPAQRTWADGIGVTKGALHRIIVELAAVGEATKDKAGKYSITEVGRNRLDGKHAVADVGKTEAVEVPNW